MLAESRSDVEYEVLAGLEKEAKKHKLLTRDEEQYWISKYKAAKAHSRDKKESLHVLITRNLALIFKFAKKSNGGCLTTYDLIIEGTLGLIHALDKYDQSRLTDKGVPMKLSTYATWWIKQYIQRSIQDRSKVVRTPIHIWELLNRVRKAHGEYCSTHPDSLGPTPVILSKMTGLTIDQVQTLGRMLYPMGSIDDKQNADDEDSLTVVAYLEASESYNADANAEVNTNKAELHKLLRQLPEDQYVFMCMKIGLVDGIDRTDKELGMVLGMKVKEVIAQEKLILEKLKLLADRQKFNL